MKGWNQKVLRFEVFFYHLHSYRPQLRKMCSHDSCVSTYLTKDMIYSGYVSCVVHMFFLFP